MVVKPNRSGGASYPSGYTDVQDHGLIGNCRTAALVSISGTVAHLCLPHFDSPSVFARILDKDHGGHFSIRTVTSTTSKQQYLPSTNILATKYLSDEGVGQISDYMPLPSQGSKGKAFLPWLIRHCKVIRGTLTFAMECAPAFDYARASHETKINEQGFAEFTCPQHINLDLRYVATNGEDTLDDVTPPKVEFDLLDLSERGHRGLGVTTTFTLTEGQTVTFVLREPPKPRTSGQGAAEESCPDHTRQGGEYEATSAEDPQFNKNLLRKLFHETVQFWTGWASQCTYQGRWREACLRSALALKLLCFAPTGSVVAAPTFSIPEDLNGAGRNWDYRYTWLRDSSFTIYALLRLGFNEEADQYVEFLTGLLKNRNEDGGLQIMYTIHGEKEIPEIELPHLDGHKGQKPLDIYGELLDAIYLAQKLSKPLAYETWLQVRSLVDYVCKVWSKPDLSIWEVRGEKQDFLYSKIMCWVAIDRGLRLADKRSLPAPNRNHWIATRDEIYEEVQTRGWNAELGFYSQSYQNRDVLDSSVLIGGLTFFMNANDPRFLSTMNQILKTKDRGGLTENGLVYRYDTNKVDDGTGGGEEGAFSMVTLWLIECLSRAGEYNKDLLNQSVVMLEDFIGYSNHLDLLSEEISKGGEPLGNFPQAFSHVSLVSCCFNVDRALKGKKRATG